MLSKLGTKNLLALIVIFIIWGGALVAIAISSFTPGAANSTNPKKDKSDVIPMTTPRPSLVSMMTAQPPPSTSTIKVHTLAPVSSSLPLLNADLYFLREGRLWYWPAQKDKLESIVTAPGDPIQAYRLMANGQKIVYLTVAGNLYQTTLPNKTSQLISASEGDERIVNFEISPDGRYAAHERSIFVQGQRTKDPSHLYLLDQITKENPSLGWSAGQFAFTPDGQYLLYSSSADQDGVYENQKASLFRLDLPANHEITELTKFGCQRLVLAPDGTKAVCVEHYREADGQENERLWLIHIPSGTAQLIGQNGKRAFSSTDLIWSQDSRWLINKACYEECSLILYEAETGQSAVLPGASCFVGCQLAYGWGPEQLWQIYLGRAPNGQSDSTLKLYLIAGLSEKKPDIQYQATETVRQPWCPSSMFFLPDKWLIFTHLDCHQKLPGEGGVYLQRPGKQPEDLMALPLARGEYLADTPTVIWSPKGDTFLYLARTMPTYEPPREARLIPLLLGTSDGSALWNVHDVLVGASNIQWSNPLNNP